MAAIQELIERQEVEPGYVQYVAHQMRLKSTQGKIKGLAGAVFTTVTKGFLLEEYKKVLAQRQKASTRKSVGEGTPVVAQAIRYRVQEAREAFDIMVRKKMAKGTTFEENLQLVYLSQGFKIEQDGEGIDWLVKKM